MVQREREREREKKDEKIDRSGREREWETWMGERKEEDRKRDKGGTERKIGWKRQIGRAMSGRKKRRQG